MIHTLVFVLLAIITLGGALAVICLKNLMHSTFLLMLTFIGVAGIYLSLQSDFLAGAQVMVYVGAVSILIVLGLMLIKRGEPTMDDTNLFAYHNLPKAVTAVLFGIVLVFSLLKTEWPGAIETSAIADSSTNALASGMMTEYVIAFELAAVLLLIALVAAIIIAKEVKDHA